MTWADQAEEHLRGLRRLHNIKRQTIRRWVRSSCDITAAKVWAPKVREPIEYLVNLHEMGHIVSPTARRYSRRSDQPFTECMCESAAWTWAVMQAEPGLVQAVQDEDWVKVGNLWVGYVRSAASTEPPDTLVD